MNRCPSCSGIINDETSLPCDLCGVLFHYACVGLSDHDAVVFIKMHKYSPHFKFLCTRCNDVLQSPPLSPSLVVGSMPQENVFFKYFHQLINKEITPIREELSLISKQLAETSELNTKKFTYAERTS